MVVYVQSMAVTSQKLRVASLHNSKTGFFKRLHSETQFQSFVFSGPQNTVVVWANRQNTPKD